MTDVSNGRIPLLWAQKEKQRSPKVFVSAEERSWLEGVCSDQVRETSRR